MLWVFIGLLGGFAFVFLTRLFWSDALNGAPARAEDERDEKGDNSRAGARRPLVTLAVITLFVALLMMIATGKLHWLSAVVTGAIPFLRRASSLMRLAPLFVAAKARATNHSGQAKAPDAAPGSLSIDQARQMLEVPVTASKADIIAAHRRLMTRNHPDKGGSNYIAAQLNNAKELLLAEL